MKLFNGDNYVADVLDVSQETENLVLSSGKLIPGPSKFLKITLSKDIVFGMNTTFTVRDEDYSQNFTVFDKQFSSLGCIIRVLI